MKLAVIFLNRIEYLDEILSVFLEIGVSGATVLDSVGMGHILSQNVPIFAGLREAFAGSSPNNKIILMLVEEEMIETIVVALEDICEEHEESKTYFMATLSIDGLYGFEKDPS